MLDATRCISYLTIEHIGETPAELAPLTGNRIYGCDICQEVCPWNRRFARVPEERDYAARVPRELAAGDNGACQVRIPGTDGPLLADLAGLDEAVWDAFTRGSALRPSRHDGLARSVEVALGNRSAVVASPEPGATIPPA